MSKLNHSGDVLLQEQINKVFDEISKIDSLEPNNLPDQLQSTLERILFSHVVIHPKKNKTRKFPQMERRDNTLWIYYFYDPKNSHLMLNDGIILQLSIAIILSVCPESFVDNLPADETVCSFSENWPEYANFSTQMYTLITSKIK